MRAQIGKGSDQYLPEFLTPEEIERFGKELDEYRSELFRRKNIFPGFERFLKCANFFSAFTTTTNASYSPVLAKRLTQNITSTCLRSAISFTAACRVTMPTSSKPAPDVFAAALKKVGDISPDDAVTVGDTRFDIEAAGKAGLKTIAFLCGGTPESVMREVGAIAIYF